MQVSVEDFRHVLSKYAPIYYLSGFGPSGNQSGSQGRVMTAPKAINYGRAQDSLPKSGYQQ